MQKFLQLHGSIAREPPSFRSSIEEEEEEALFEGKKKNAVGMGKMGLVRGERRKIYKESFLEVQVVFFMGYSAHARTHKKLEQDRDFCDFWAKQEILPLQGFYRREMR